MKKGNKQIWVPVYRAAWSDEKKNYAVKRVKEGATLAELSKELHRRPFDVIMELRQISGLQKPIDPVAEKEFYKDLSKTKKELYHLNGSNWSSKERETLRAEFQGGLGLFELAKSFQRTQEAITDELQHQAEDDRIMNEFYEMAILRIKYKPLPSQPIKSEDMDVNSNDSNMSIEEMELQLKELRSDLERMMSSAILLTNEQRYKITIGVLEELGIEISPVLLAAYKGKDDIPDQPQKEPESIMPKKEKTTGNHVIVKDEKGNKISTRSNQNTYFKLLRIVGFDTLYQQRLSYGKRQLVHLEEELNEEEKRYYYSLEGFMLLRPYRSNDLKKILDAISDNFHLSWNISLQSTRKK